MAELVDALALGASLFTRWEFESPSAHTDNLSKSSASERQPASREGITMLEQKNLSLLQRYGLEFAVFMSGAAVMIFELVGSRITAPYIGTSIYAWSSLIGVILASLSVGYFVGGRYADSRPSLKPLATILLLAAVAIALTATIKDFIALLITGWVSALELKSVFIALLLFAPASFLFGMVSPYALRLRLHDVDRSGKTVGNLSALSTVGSIVGTFLAGFVIIPHFGSTHSLMLLSFILLLTALNLMSGTRPWKAPKTLLVVLVSLLGLAQLVALAEEKIFVANIDTLYNRIMLLQTTDHATQKPILALATDPYGLQAAMFTDGTDDLVFDYTKFYRLFSHFVPQPKDVLMLGGGAYTYPRDFLKRFPEAKADVVEIDPGMTEVAQAYFGFTQPSNMSIYHQDARLFINENTKQYDAILMDVFNSAPVIPFHLTTKEAVRRVYQSLREGGVVMVNLVSAIDGEQGKFARAEYATYQAVFPQVYLYSIQNIPDGNTPQSLMLVAIKSDDEIPPTNTDEELQCYLTHRWVHPIAQDMPLLTDDFAPVEYYRRSSL